MVRINFRFQRESFLARRLFQTGCVTYGAHQQLTILIYKCGLRRVEKQRRDVTGAIDLVISRDADDFRDRHDFTNATVAHQLFNTHSFVERIFVRPEVARC